jgi:hypothetical protein
VFGGNGATFYQRQQVTLNNKLAELRRGWKVYDLKPSPSPLLQLSSGQRWHGGKVTSIRWSPCWH